MVTTVRGGRSWGVSIRWSPLLLTVAEPGVPYLQISRRLGIPAGGIGPTRARTSRKLADTGPVCALAS